MILSLRMKELQEPRPSGSPCNTPSTKRPRPPDYLTVGAPTHGLLLTLVLLRRSGWRSSEWLDRPLFMIFFDLSQSDADSLSAPFFRVPLGRRCYRPPIVTRYVDAT